MEELENKIEVPCIINTGDVFVSADAKMPDGFCLSAWNTIKEYVFRLANGETKLFDDWMKNEKSVFLSCNDGFRPVSFLIEVIREDTQAAEEAGLENR